jgi:vacuolar-type H+-ATPase subunit F/Vma7
VIKSLDIEDRIIKVVCDQDANIKKAFKSTVEADDVDLIKITKDLLIHQNHKDVSERLAQLESEHILEISEMNKFTGDGNTLKRKREQILDELDLEMDDLTDNESSDDDSYFEDDDDDSVDELLNEVERLSNKWHYFD